MVELSLVPVLICFPAVQARSRSLDGEGLIVHNPWVYATNDTATVSWLLGLTCRAKRQPLCGLYVRKMTVANIGASLFQSIQSKTNFTMQHVLGLVRSRGQACVSRHEVSNPRGSGTIASDQAGFRYHWWGSGHPDPT